MFKYIGLIFFIIGFIGLNLAASFPDPQRYSGMETESFKPGTSPDANYVRNVDMFFLQIDELYPDSSFSQIDTIQIGLHGDETNRMRAIFWADISSLPDSAVINEAILRIPFINGPDFSGNLMRHVQLHRILIYTDSSATWNDRSTDSSAAWNKAGCEDIVGRIDNLFGAGAGAGFKTGTNWLKSGFDRPTIGGIYLPAGYDSVDNGYNMTNAADRAAGADFTTYINVSSASSVWLEFDITKAVSMWHTGQWDNYGLLMRYPASSPYVNAVEQDDAFYGADSLKFISTASSTALLVPQLDIRYLYSYSAPQSGGGSGSSGIDGASGIN